MKTQSELNADIFELTNTIQTRFPELIKYLNEMPVALHAEAFPGENLKALRDYCNSLETLIKDYSLTHHSPQ